MYTVFKLKPIFKKRKIDLSHAIFYFKITNSKIYIQNTFKLSEISLFKLLCRLVVSLVKYLLYWIKTSNLFPFVLTENVYCVLLTKRNNLTGWLLMLFLWHITTKITVFRKRGHWRKKKKYPEVNSLLYGIVPELIRCILAMNNKWYYNIWDHYIFAKLSFYTYENTSQSHKYEKRKKIYISLDV